MTPSARGSRAGRRRGASGRGDIVHQPEPGALRLTAISQTGPTPFEEAVSHTLGIEGGYADHADDPGGKTQWGVTEAVARADGYSGPMSRLPKRRALDIYRRLYWDRIGLDHVARVSRRVALECFDTGVNCGVSIPVRFLQRLLNVLNGKGRHWPDIKVDGAAGPATARSLGALMERRGRDGETVLLRYLKSLKGERYVEIAENNENLESFIFGWGLHRL